MGPARTETSIRSMADAIFNRVNWTFMSQGPAGVAMGWQPTSGFSGYGNWIGYNEAMISTASAWERRPIRCPLPPGADGPADTPGALTMARPSCRFRLCLVTNTPTAGSTSAILRTLT